MNKKVIYAALMFVVTMSSGKASAQQLPYQNPALSAHERAVDLCGRLTLEEKASLMLDDSPAIPRLGIKRFQWWSETLHGVANMGDVTVFPEPIGMAASFNDRMVYRVFDATSDEMRAKWNELQQKGGDVTRFHALQDTSLYLAEEKLALVSLGDCTPGLAPFDFNSDNSKWNFRQQ